MSDPSDWQTAVPLVEDGDAVNANNKNASTHVLAERTAVLKNIVDSIEAGEKLVLRDAPVKDDVIIGDTVYFNTDTLQHEKCLPVYESLVTTNGRLLPAQSAILTGVVVNKNSGVLGDIATAGFTVLTDTVMTNMFGTLTPTPGVYYMDPENAGKVINTAPATLLVRTVRYMAANIIQVFQPDFEPETHHHKVYTIEPTDWIAATATAPAGYNHQLDFTTANAIAQMMGEIILPSVGEGTFVYDYVDPTDPTEPTSNDLTGKHIASGVGALLQITENGVYWLDATAPTQNIELTITTADTKGEALLNTLLTQTAQALQTFVVNGRAYVNLREYTDNPGNAGFQVVKDIDFANHELILGDVVESINVGQGLSITTTQGNPVITLDEFSENLIEASVYNLNNSISDVDGNTVFTLFPDDRPASVSLRAQIPNLPDDSLYEVIIWAQYIGVGAAVTPGLALDAEVLPTPDVSGVNPSVPAGYPTTLPDVPNGVGTDFFYVESATPIDATGLARGTVMYTLSASNPSTGIKLLNTGILLRLK
jgi:hypothetical protein